MIKQLEGSVYLNDWRGGEFIFMITAKKILETEEDSHGVEELFAPGRSRIGSNSAVASTSAPETPIALGCSTHSTIFLFLIPIPSSTPGSCPFRIPSSR